MKSRLILALALQRLAFLRSDEKLVLWDLIDDESRLAVLSLNDVESIVCRRLAGRAWSPAALLGEAEGDALYLDRIGALYLHFDDPAYPPLLRETSRPPFGLYLRGQLPDPGLPSAAVVGTRLPTGRGLASATSLCRELGRSGIPVVSGLARGIDSAAHRGAISGGGRTWAVLPCGIDRVYPPAHRGLAARILETGGLLMSEYPPGAGIHKYRFPERNRIIAGIARACVVIEAPAKSGALITSDHALSEGRDVWVSAPCLGGPRSAGIDALAEEGAKALSGAAELLADWSWPDASLAGPSGPRRDPSRISAGLSGAEGNLIDMKEGRRLADSLRVELGLGSEGAEGRSPRTGE